LRNWKVLWFGLGVHQTCKNLNRLFLQQFLSLISLFDLFIQLANRLLTFFLILTWSIGLITQCLIFIRSASLSPRIELLLHCTFLERNLSYRKGSFSIGGDDLLNDILRMFDFGELFNHILIIEVDIHNIDPV
jgi:hypothetical protein